jgi:hypothetical protein
VRHSRLLKLPLDPVMQEFSTPLGLLGAMITPAVLISACGALIFSTSTRLARIVDRVRTLSHDLEEIFTGKVTEFADERLAEYERQLTVHTRRGRLIQRSLTSFYVSLGLLTAATVMISVTALLDAAEWLPSALGVAGTLALFYGSMLLVAETRLALGSVTSEMEFVLRLRDRYREHSEKNGNS